MRKSGSTTDTAPRGTRVVMKPGEETRCGPVHLSTTSRTSTRKETSVVTTLKTNTHDTIGPSVVAGTGQPPNSTFETATIIGSFCGPDMTDAYVGAINRVRRRLMALPDSEHGPWDGACFLSRNAGTMDVRVRFWRQPGFDNPEADARDGLLCPQSAPCDGQNPSGQTTFMLCGICLPQHVGNDIMYGFVAQTLGVPRDVQVLGGHWAQLNTTYSSLDPPQSHAAYRIGNNLADWFTGDRPTMTREDFCRLVNGARFSTGDGIVTAVRTMTAVSFIQSVYTWLPQCDECPENSSRPGEIMRDWTTSSWSLDDGTSATWP
jgi:hypothetical protein